MIELDEARLMAGGEQLPQAPPMSGTGLVNHKPVRLWKWSLILLAIPCVLVLAMKIFASKPAAALPPSPGASTAAEPQINRPRMGGGILNAERPQGIVVTGVCGDEVSTADGVALWRMHHPSNAARQLSANGPNVIYTAPQRSDAVGGSNNLSNVGGPSGGSLGGVGVNNLPANSPVSPSR